MLSFTRKRTEKFRIGDDIIVTISDIQDGRVRIGIDAPRDVAIYREELYQDIKEQGLKQKKGVTCAVQSNSQS